MPASTRWNLSKDYYDILPADSEMVAPDDYRCDNCDRITEAYREDALYFNEVCYEDCEDDE